MSNERIILEHKDLSTRFLKPQQKTSFKQYCNIYDIRLQILSPIIEDQLRKKFENKYQIIHLHELLNKSFLKCIVTGTIFKNLKLRPSLVEQVSRKSSIDSHSHPTTNLTDPTDVVYIENKYERYMLSNVDSTMLVTGLVCGALISNAGNGKLFVHEIYFPGFPPQISSPLAPDCYIVFISGLNLADSFPDIRLNLFFNWISGTIGTINEIQTANIAALIIAGNSITNKPAIFQSTTSLVSRTTLDETATKAIEKFDLLLTFLSKHINVYILPSKNDPSDYILPQNPMHRCMFPNSSPYDSIHFVSNPYECEFGGIRILGSSGECVRDVLRCSNVSSAIEVLENCLKWRHLAPTAPDTLGCFPFEKEDPFIIKECPRVLFAGNQEEFGSRIIVGLNFSVTSNRYSFKHHNYQGSIRVLVNNNHHIRRKT